MEAAAECIPTKPKAKCRVPKESLVVREKRDNLKTKHLYSIKETQCQRAEI